MTIRRTRRDSGDRFRMEPVGGRGVDLGTSPELLAPGTLRRAEWIRSNTRAVRKADGSRKITLVTPDNHAIVFGADTKYGTVTTPSEWSVGIGGFALRVTLTIEWPASGKTAYPWSNRVSGQTYGILWPTVSDAGVVTFNARLASGSTVSLTTSAIADGSTAHFWLIYDAPTGDMSLYVDGEVVDTEAIGTTASLLQTAVSWYFGVEWEPGGAAVTADTHFDGALDAFCLMSLGGQRISDGTPSVLDQFRALSFQTWPNPRDPRVLACFDFDKASGTTVTDRSRFRNDMTLVGGPSFVTGIAYPAAPTNLISVFQRPDASRDNLWAAQGTLYHQQMKGAQT